MSFTPIVLTGQWQKPDGSPAAGSVVASLTEGLVNTSQPAAQIVNFAYLDANGNLAMPVYADNDTGTNPVGSQYYCTVTIIGSPRTAGYIVVPAVPAGSRSVTDAVIAESSTTLTSATASFTGADVGKFVYSPDLVVGTAIASVTNSTTVVVSLPALASGTGQTLLIGASASLPALLAA